MPLVLRQIVGDNIPRRFRSDEDMMGRTDGRIVDERSHRDVNKGAVADEGIEERAAGLAVGVMGLFAAVDEKVVGAARNPEFPALDAGEGLEGRARRAAAIRAM